MKIKVHEIDGDYYCAVDDIAQIKAQKTRQSITPLSELENIYNSISLFWHIHNVPIMEKRSFAFPENLTQKERENALFSLVGEVFTELLNNGIYQVSHLFFLVNYGTGFFRIDRSNDEDSRPQRVEIEMLNIDKGMMQEDRVIFNYNGAKWHNEHLGKSFSNNPFSIQKSNARDFYILWVDAKIYLADVATDDDFIMPDNEPVTQQTKPTTEQATTETQSILNDQGDYFSPYLAIAIDIWERAYIYGEIVSIEKEKPSITKDKGEPIKNIIEKHYPNLKDSWIKNIADIIKTYQGESIKKINGGTD